MFYLYNKKKVILKDNTVKLLSFNSLLQDKKILKNSELN